MPKHGGNDYLAMYYNKKGKINQKRNKGKRAKPTSTDILAFLEETMVHFKRKYNITAKQIIMSQEMKDMIDAREKGKAFLKRINLVVNKKEDLGLRTIYLSDIFFTASTGPPITFTTSAIIIFPTASSNLHR